MVGRGISGTTRLRHLCATMLLTAAMSSPGFGWSVSGIVKDESGQPLSGVAVGVKDSANLKATTNASGAFTLTRPVGVESRLSARGGSIQIEGSDLVMAGLADGPVDLSVVDVSGRDLWTARTTSVQGNARVAFPRLSRGALFLRVRNAEGVEHRALVLGEEGVRIGQAAGRAQASYPVLTFTLSGYTDTTYAMTASDQTGVTMVMKKPVTCALPSAFKWKDYGGPVAGPKNGWAAIKDFTHVAYNGKHYVYMTYYLNGWNSAQMAPFTNWSDAAGAVQTKTNTGVAPELMYYTPKKTWIMSKQWCAGGSFCWMESNDVSSGSSFALKGNLLTETITDPKADGTKPAPIDQTLICDDAKCYIFYADDNGRIYRGSMPKANFPGTFTGTTKILQDTQARLFEAVEVYKIKGQKLYLMIVECMSPRYFRAFTATDLGGTWTPLAGGTTQAQPFAGKVNVTGGWSDDISHGDLIRSTYDEYKEVDPCNLQLLYQGYKAPYTGDYGNIPYQMGLLTLIR